MEGASTGSCMCVRERKRERGREGEREGKGEGEREREREINVYKEHVSPEPLTLNPTRNPSGTLSFCSARAAAFASPSGLAPVSLRAGSVLTRFALYP